MERDNKKLIPRAFLIYAAVNIVTYALAHMEYLFMNDTVGEILAYFSYYVSKSVEFIAPPVIAAITFLVFADGGIKKAFTASLAISSARFFYSLPYYYLIFIYKYRYDSIESLCLSLGASLLIILLTSVGALICVGAAIWVLKKSGVTAPDQIADIAKDRVSTDFLNKACMPITVFVLMRTAFSLVLEIIDTVLFFIEYGADYTAAEIITMLVNYVLILILLVASYLVCMAIKNAIVNRGEAKEAE